MFDFIQKQPKNRMEEEMGSKYTRQMALGLQYLYENKVIHHDIHTDNILLDNGVLKIANFGYSVEGDSCRITMCGMLDYLAPEKLNNRQHDHKVDLWALGVLTYKFFVGKATLEAGEDDGVIGRILNMDVRFPSFVSKDACGLIKILETESQPSCRSGSDLPAGGAAGRRGGLASIQGL